MTIIFPHPKPHPIPLNRRRRNNYFRAFSPKLNRLMEFESELEYQHWILQETNPSVISLCEQFPQFSGVDQARRFTYTFDLHIRDQNGIETCIEVKPRNKLLLNDEGVLVPKDWHRAQNAAQEWGVECRFITEENLEPHQTWIRNWASLLPFVQRAKSEGLEKIESRVLKLIDHDTPQSFDSLARKIKDAYPDQVMAATCNLIHQGHLVVNELAEEIFHPQLIVRASNYAT